VFRSFDLPQTNTGGSFESQNTGCST